MFSKSNLAYTKRSHARNISVYGDMVVAWFCPSMLLCDRLSGMKELKDTYDEIAQDWHIDHMNDDWWLAHIGALTSLLPAHASILDVGCGPGHKSRYFMEQGFKVTGIDFSPQMVEISRDYVPSAAFDVLDMYDIATITERFDCVYVCAALLHIPKKDCPEVIKNMSMLLNPEGLLYVSVKELRSDQEEEAVYKEHDYGYEYERFFSYFSRVEVEEYFKNAGLEIVHSDVTPSGKTNWIQVIGRRVG